MAGLLQQLLGRNGSASATHNINVTTGDKQGAGTDGDVFVTLKSEKVYSQELELNLTWHNDFENGSTDVYFFTLTNLRKITEITVRRNDARPSDSWFVDNIQVQFRETGEISVFPVHRWIEANDILTLQEFDSLHPQDDKHEVQRENYLNKKKSQYKFTNAPNEPGRVTGLPKDEQFSISYQFQIGVLAAKLFSQTTLQNIRNCEFKTLRNIEEFYGGILERPKGISNWRSDVEFANQRLTGVNPAVIELCTRIPDHMPVTEEMVAESLEGNSLSDMLLKKKIYKVDLRYLANITCNPGRNLVGPTALFYSRLDGTLIPIAIQLMPTPSQDNPIFLPSDPEYVWLSAKMWFNSADSAHHEAHAHLGMTHFLIEGLAVCSHRQLSQSHPLFRLLAPHFLYVMAINNLAMDRLVNEGGFVDEVMGMGRVGMFNIIRRNWPKWDLFKNGNLPEDLKNRGVDDSTALPNYHYRDDALLIWDALRDYVSTILQSVYDTPEKISKDFELQAWANELADNQNGAGIGGMPSSIKSVKQLIEIVTTFIFTSSVQHAAVNFMQYDEYAFPPNYPAWLTGEPPKSKEPLSETDIVKSIADKDKMIQTIIIMRILSSKATKSLGDFEINYAYDKTSMDALKLLRSSLQGVSYEIERRNERRVLPYSYLNPKHIPNAISI